VNSAVCYFGIKILRIIKVDQSKFFGMYKGRVGTCYNAKIEKDRLLVENEFGRKQNVT
jgi:hypothetical protein